MNRLHQSQNFKNLYNEYNLCNISLFRQTTKLSIAELKRFKRDKIVAKCLTSTKEFAIFDEKNLTRKN